MATYTEYFGITIIKNELEKLEIVKNKLYPIIAQ